MVTKSPNTGFTIWFTGLSGSGKTTVAHRVGEVLQQRLGRGVEILDGDVVRTHLSKGLGFSREDRDTNIRRIGWVCHILTKHGVPNIAAAISPYRDVRNEVRKMIGSFVEVYAKCPIEVCEQRDVKGLYRKARAGEIKQFTGVDDPYEAPLDPEVTLHTDRESVEESTKKGVTAIEKMGWLSR
jgi:adenylylsulfate kinase